MYMLAIGLQMAGPNLTPESFEQGMFAYPGGLGPLGSWKFGPGDYSMSIGVPGQFDHPQVVEAERHVIETALRKGVAPRAEISEPREAERYLKLGVRHFCIGEDVSILYEWFRRSGGAMRALLSEVGAAAPA